jgi:hypothetical protein
MQIFSKLQRNSFNYVFITILILFAVGLLNSSFVYVPWLLGSVIFCGNLFFGVVYIAYLAVLHQFNPVYLFLVMILYKFFLKERIQDYFNVTYQDVVGVFFVYSALFPYFYFFFKDFSFLLILFIYNFAVDVIVIKVTGCGLK